MLGAIGIGIAAAAIAVAVYALVKISELYDLISRVTVCLKDLSEKTDTVTETVNEMAAAYESAKELIEATTQYTQEATKREVAMQEGINAIMNYDALSFRTMGGEKT